MEPKLTQFALKLHDEMLISPFVEAPPADDASKEDP